MSMGLKCEYAKSAENGSVFEKMIVISVLGINEDGSPEYGDLTLKVYNAFNKNTGKYDIKITEEEFNAGIPISEAEADALIESLKEKAVA